MGVGSSAVRLIMEHRVGGLIVFYATDAHLYLCSMATRITNKPTGIILSSAIGDIVISSDASFVDVKLTTTGSIIILEERYYSFRNEITLHNISSLIEAQMRKMGESISSFILTVYANDSSSGLASIIRIFLMYYHNLESFLNDPESDQRRMIEKARESPPKPSIFDCQIY